MDVAGLSRERSARSVAARPINSRDRRTRRPLANVARPEPAHLGQARPPLAPSGDADPSAPDAADRSQADYFMRLLSQNRRLTEQRLEDYQKAIIAAQAAGDVEAVCNFRRMARIEEQDRDSLDGMLDKLRRRFARPRVQPPTGLSSRPRSAVR